MSVVAHQLETETSPADGARDLAVALPADFALDCGCSLAGAEFRFRLSGPADAPVVVAAGGISSNRFVHSAGHTEGWWDQVVAPGGGIDCGAFRILGFDFLTCPDDGKSTITTRDQARALAFALDAAGIATVHAFVGASYGGMVGLAFAAEFPERLRRLCVISAAHRAHPMATAQRGIQRRIVKFGVDSGDPAGGVALARELAMTTYRSTEEFGQRFNSESRGERAGDPFDVCEYLVSRGRAFAAWMSPERFIALSDSMDRHRINPARLSVPTLLIGVKNDRLVPIEDLRMLANAVGGRDSLVEIESVYGHDAFLLEPGILNPLLRDFTGGNPS